MQEIKPLFDFSTNKSDILIHQSSAEISINEHTYKGNGEVRLELLPRANIYISMDISKAFLSKMLYKYLLGKLILPLFQLKVTSLKDFV